MVDHYTKPFFFLRFIWRNYIILQTILWRHFYYHHFPDEKIEASKVKVNIGRHIGIWHLWIWIWPGVSDNEFWATDCCANQSEWRIWPNFPTFKCISSQRIMLSLWLYFLQIQKLEFTSKQVYFALCKISIFFLCWDQVCMTWNTFEMHRGVPNVKKSVQGPLTLM